MRFQIDIALQRGGFARDIRIHDDARVAIADIVRRGHVPILAGGTGLYFQALLRGLAPMPQADRVTMPRADGRKAAKGAAGAVFTTWRRMMGKGVRPVSIVFVIHANR